MTFPTTAVLDDFNRSDDTAIGGDWTQMMRTGSEDFGISSNQLYNPNATWQAMYYDAAQYGPDCEVYIELPTMDADYGQLNLYFRMKDVTADSWIFDGYVIIQWRYDSGGTPVSDTYIIRVDNSSQTQLGATVIFTDHGNGDKFGARAIGSSLEMFYDDGVGWESRATRTDSTYSAAGYLGIYLDLESVSRMDNFGGGTFNPIPRIMHHRKQGR